MLIIKNLTIETIKYNRILLQDLNLSLFKTNFKYTFKPLSDKAG